MNDTTQNIVRISEDDLRRLCSDSIADLPEWDPSFALTERQMSYAKAASPQMMLAILDQFADARRGLDMLSSAISEAGVSTGHIVPGTALEGPHLLMILADMVTMLKEAEPDAARYRHLIDPAIPGSIRQIGVSHRDNEAYWMTGDEANAAIDADMAPPSDNIPDFTPGNGNEARRRAASLGIDFDASMKARAIVPIVPVRPWWLDAPPLSDDERQCHEPTCWACNGTGRDRTADGAICEWNDEIPF